MIVNDKEIKVFNLDTPKSVTIRIATELNTLPKYIVGLPDTLLEEKEIQVQDLLQIIKTDASQSLDFEGFVQANQALLLPFNIREDVLDKWLIYNTQLEELSSYSSLILDEIGKKLVDSGYFASNDEFIRFWKQRKVIRDQFESVLADQKRSDQETIELYQRFEDIQQGLVYTNFELERTSFNMILDLPPMNILELFNQIIVNEAAPFAYCQQYYKLLKDYIPNSEWTTKDTFGDTIHVRVNDKTILDLSKYKDYNDVTTFLDPIKNELITTLNLVTERGYLTIDQFINRFGTILPGSQPIRYKQLEETKVIGTFYFPQERIDTYVFADLVMNNSLFFSLINIDESSKATKKKRDSSQPWLYIHFNHPNTGLVTAAITQQVVNRAEPLMRDKDQDIFPHGSPYIRVKAKGRNRRSIELFQQMLSKLLVIYGEEYNDIVDAYRKFLPDFGIIQEIQVPELKQSDLAPEIFVSNFSRFCAEARYPTIIGDDDIKLYQSQGKEIMSFPRKEPKTGKVYPSDGSNIRNYICLNPEYPYPGIQENNLANSDEYPFLPCCFKNPQSNKKGGLYRHYYFDEELVAKEKKQQGIIITNKILDPDTYGRLSPELKKFFELMDPNPNYEYLRIGMNRGYSSLLNAVMVGLQSQTGILQIPRNKRESMIRKTRRDLASPKIAVLARQSLYDTSTSQIIERLKDENQFMNPQYYIQLLENYFKCRIFVFDNNLLTIPRHIQSYYLNEESSKLPVLFIYQHMGSESDKAKYPQCELIIRTKTGDLTDIQYSYNLSLDPLAINVNKVFNQMNTSWTLNQLVQPISFPLWETNLKLVSQVIDTYGKTRCVNIEYKGKKVSLLTSPIPPLPMIEDQRRTPYCTTPSMAREIMEFGNLRDITSKDNSTQGLLGNVQVRICTNKADSATETDPSKMQVFNQNKKLARYLSEYVFWTFSRYMQDQQIQLVTDQVLADYAQSIFQIKPNHTYSNVSKLFTTTNDIYSQGKLIVSSEEMIKRLMYVLKLYSIRDLKSLQSYYTQPSIRQYYVDITDFDVHPNQIILQGYESMMKWINDNNNGNMIKDYIQVGQFEPYFFQNRLVENGRMLLAQNATSLSTALSVAYHWYKWGYNMGLDAPVMEQSLRFKLYSYKNPLSIESYIVKGDIDYPKIIVMGYKIEGTAYYTALLPLS